MALSDGTQVRGPAGGGGRRARQRGARGARDRRAALGLRAEGAGLLGDARRCRTRGSRPRSTARAAPSRWCRSSGPRTPRRWSGWRRGRGRRSWPRCRRRTSTAALGPRACGVLGRAAARRAADALADRRAGRRPARRPAHGARRRGGARRAADRGAGSQHVARGHRHAARALPRGAADVGGRELRSRATTGRGTARCWLRIAGIDALNRAAMAGARPLRDLRLRRAAGDPRHAAAPAGGDAARPRGSGRHVAVSLRRPPAGRRRRRRVGSRPVSGWQAAASLECSAEQSPPGQAERAPRRSISAKNSRWSPGRAGLAFMK